MDKELKRILDIESWCFKNNILIFPKAINNNQLKIVVNYKGKSIEGKKVFKSVKSKIKSGDEKWWEVIYALRESYYNNAIDNTNK